ncbi:MAG: hypothetical protein J0L92_25530 [Deltaproteobacteria bacterium]|nr:hypothetical protein [Deltaproteobacteria bacterium]
MSGDGARTWTERGVGFEGFSLTAIGERVWLSGGDGALESRDAGATFTPMANGATRVDQPALGWLLAWRDAAPFAYSVDEGASWRPYGGPQSVAGSLDALYGERGGRLATSVDRGETWAELGSAVGVTALSGAGDIVVYETAGDLFVRRGELVRTLRMRRALDEAPFAPVLGGDGAIYVTIQRQALDPSSSLLEYELARSVDGEVWERRAALPEVVGAVVDVETAYWVRGDEVVITDDGGVSSRVLAPPPLGEPGYALPFAAVDRTAYAIGRALAEPRTWLLASTDGAEWVSLGPTPAWSVARGRDRLGRLYAITVETAARQALRWSEATGWESWPLDTGCEVVVIGDEAARHCEGGTRHCLTLLEGTAGSSERRGARCRDGMG